jgi:hypothetical protein
VTYEQCGVHYCHIAITPGPTQYVQQSRPTQPRLSPRGPDRGTLTILGPPACRRRSPRHRGPTLRAPPPRTHRSFTPDAPPSPPPLVAGHRHHHPRWVAAAKGATGGRSCAWAIALRSCPRAGDLGGGRGRGEEGGGGLEENLLIHNKMRSKKIVLLQKSPISKVGQEDLARLQEEGQISFSTRVRKCMSIPMIGTHHPFTTSPHKRHHSTEHKLSPHH